MQYIALAAAGIFFEQKISKEHPFEECQTGVFTGF
jgi:hypothetical protein